MEEQKIINESGEDNKNDNKPGREKKHKKFFDFVKKKTGVSEEDTDKKEKKHRKFPVLKRKKVSVLEQEEAVTEEAVTEENSIEENSIEENSIEKKSTRFKKVKNKLKQDKGNKEPKKGAKKFKIPGIRNISIKIQLIVGFVVPIVFLVIVGVVSYQKAATGLIENYEVSAENTISTQMKYMDYGLSLIRDDVVQMKLDAELQSLVVGTYKNNTSKATDVFNKTNRNLSIKQAQNIFINSLYMIPKSDNRVITSTAHEKPQGFFETWIKTEEGVACAVEGSIWVGEHPEIDGVLGNSKDNYIMSYVSIFSNNAAVMVADISAQTILESLSGIDITEGAMIAFSTADGRELVLKEESNEEEIVFGEQEFFKKAMEGEEISGTEYVTYNGSQYLFIFNKSEVTGAIIVYLVPESKVTASAANIKNITVVLIIVASVIAAMIGTLISVNISVSMSGIIKRLKKVAEGDLTVQMKVKGKDEFSVLSREIMEVISNTHSLIQEVESIAALVSDATDNVERASVRVEQSSNNISEALLEIDSGVNLQAEDAQSCLGQMDGLSMALKNVGHEIDSVVASSEETKEIVTKSIGTMEELLGQTQDTIEVTKRVKDDISMLAQKSGEIRKFVNIIAEIADETNLLSLNASIEAARAGEAGRGFAVVAEEIRKLADGSQKAANEINKVVESIINQTNDTVQTAERAGKIVAEQSESVNQTKEVFGMIFESTEEMLERVNQIADSVQSMDGQRESTLLAIASISAVSEETAAASTNVYNIAQSQTDVVDSLRKASEELQNKMDELERVLSVFITG